ncbi:MAG: alpha-L-arabinofuranosidase [Fibrobacterota bacterium]|nr:MAG: alpha-L-arabinofuranosidase [Fibrobacterota bacterium]
MKSHKSTFRGKWPLMSTIAILTGSLAATSFGWSASGTVKNSTGNLSGVTVYVKNVTPTVSVVTGADGTFNLTVSGVELGMGRKSAFTARIAQNDLILDCPQDGALELALVDGAGRKLWNASAQATQGVARATLPSQLRTGAAFLQVKQSGETFVQPVTIGANGARIASHLSARASAVGSVLVFKKTDYDSATYTMTSDSQTGISITLTASNPTTCELGTTFKWKDWGKPIAEPKNGWLAIKDFTMVRYNNQYIVYMTYTPPGGGFKGAYMTPFSTFADAAAATQAVMPNNLPGVAPELIYFTPKNTWVYTTQWCATGSFCYTTGSDPTKPTSFAAQTKPLLTENITPNAPIDQVVICDDTNCFLFYADDKGNIYRGSMAKGSFPANFTGTKKILSETDPAKLFEAVEVYKIKGQKKYLMIVECGYPRYFRAFTATDLGGTWTPIANTINAATPFAGPKNVTGGWSNDISHGEIVRTGSDEYREIDPCNMQMIYQGLTTGGDYNSLPYKMGHLTRVP